jgi:putative DNA primase/helicase
MSIRDDLEARAVELVSHLLGFGPNRALSNSRQSRWGRKGSFALAVTGSKHGCWYDHEVGEGGGLLSLIAKRATGGDFGKAVRWARRWLRGDGQPTPTGEAVRRIQHEASNAEKAAEQAADDARRGADARRRFWHDARALKGTPGESYLRWTRGIEARRWPSSILWNQEQHAIVCAVTSDARKVVAVQIIRVTRDGKKDDGRGRTKQSHGPVSRGVVRLPGRATGPLCICEGPETGLSVWAATGYETWILLGSLKRAAAVAPRGRRVVLCRDDDKRTSPAAKVGKTAIRAMRAAGVDVVDAFPWGTRRADKSDFNDLARESGLDAVRQRINLAAIDRPSIGRILVPVQEARKRIDRRVRGFFDLASGWREGETPPVHALGVTVGAGKTDAALRHSLRLLEQLREDGDGRVIVVAVPEHRLSAEIAGRFNALAREQGVDLRAEVWRGREAKRPGGGADERMCGDLTTVREALPLAVDVDKEVCRACRLARNCAYVAQRAADADLWIVAHNIIFHAPVSRRGVAALVIDESPWQAGLVGIEGHGVEIPLDALEPGVMPTPPRGVGVRLVNTRQRLATALRAAPDGPVSRADLDAAGFDNETGLDAVRLEWRRKVDSGPWPLRLANKTLGPMTSLWRGVAALMADDGPALSGWLTLDRNRDGARVVRVTGRAEVGKAWRVPTLLVDAVLDTNLVRPYWPNIEDKGQFNVQAPHQVIRQAAGKSFSKAALAPPKTAGGDDKPRAKARRNIRAVILKRARELGGRALVVGNKATVEAMQFPRNVDVAWFNAVAGRDQWKRVRLVVILGRPMPPPRAVEQIAAALIGVAPARLEGWYERGDAYRQHRDGAGARRVFAESDRHPDRMVERIRARICVGEIIQAIGRGRGVNRSLETPLEVLVLGDVILPVAVDQFLPDEALNPSPIDLMLAEGGVAFEAAASAATAYPQLWPTRSAAKKALQRANRGTFSKKNIPLRKCPPVRFQRVGPKLHVERAVYDPRLVRHPRAAIEAMLGPLAMFELIGAGPETAKAANVSRGEEGGHDATIDTIWVSMKWHDEQELEDEKAYHLLFDEDEDSTSVPA